MSENGTNPYSENDKPPCNGTRCPLCGADPPERPFCAEVCKEPIFHTWEIIYAIRDKLQELETAVRMNSGLLP